MLEVTESQNSSKRTDRGAEFFFCYYIPRDNGTIVKAEVKVTFRQEEVSTLFQCINNREMADKEADASYKDNYYLSDKPYFLKDTKYELDYQSASRSGKRSLLFDYKNEVDKEIGELKKTIKSSNIEKKYTCSGVKTLYFIHSEKGWEDLFEKDMSFLELGKHSFSIMEDLDSLLVFFDAKRKLDVMMEELSLNQLKDFYGMNRIFNF